MPCNTCAFSPVREEGRAYRTPSLPGSLRGIVAEWRSGVGAFFLSSPDKLLREARQPLVLKAWRGRAADIMPCMGGHIAVFGRA